MSIIDRIADIMDEMIQTGRRPGRLLIGDREAAENEAELTPYCRRFGWPDPEVVTMKGTGTMYGVPIERVDVPSLLGLVAEGSGR